MRSRNPLYLASLSAALLLGSACNEWGKQDEPEAGERPAEGVPAAEEVGQEAEKQPAGEPAGRRAAYEPFKAQKDETGQAFATRADAVIIGLERDIQQIRSQAGAKMTDQTRQQLQDVQEALTEAKNELQEVRTDTGTEMQPNRQSIAQKITEAQSQVTRAREQMAQPKM